MQVALIKTLLLIVACGFLGLDALAFPLTVDRISLRETTDKVNQLYGNPKYFDTEGFSKDQHATRSFYGKERGLPAIEWDSKFRVTRVAGLSLQKDGQALHKGANRRDVRTLLGWPSEINGTVESYLQSSSELQVFYNTEGRVKMFNLITR